jgi:hypothetical protein
MNCVRDIRNYKRAVIGSDHYLIVLNFIAKLPKPPSKERMASKRFDIPKLKDPIARQQCIEEKLNEAKEAWTSDVDANWSLLSSEITEVAEEVLGRPPVTERTDWFDEECRKESKILPTKNRGANYCVERYSVDFLLKIFLISLDLDQIFKFI